MLEDRGRAGGNWKLGGEGHGAQMRLRLPLWQRSRVGCVWGGGGQVGGYLAIRGLAWSRRSIQDCLCGGGEGEGFWRTGVGDMEETEACGGDVLNNKRGNMEQLFLILQW